MGSGFSFLSLPAFPASLCSHCSLVPNSVCPVHLSNGMAWPWFGSASDTFLANLGRILITLPLIQTRVFCPALGPAGQTYFPARAQAG